MIPKFIELSPLEYLLADIACSYDKTNEKIDWKERVRKGTTVIKIAYCYLEASYNQLIDPLKLLNIVIGFNETDEEHMTDTKLTTDQFDRWLCDKDNPVRLKAALLAYNDIILSRPTGYLISLDASSSGIQLLSILSSCKTTFGYTGGNTECTDLYNYVYQKYLKRLDENKTPQNLNENTYDIDRKKIKKGVMTAFYGSIATPRKLVGEDNLDVFFETLSDTLPGAWALNEYLIELWDIQYDKHKKNTRYGWTLPDGFEVKNEIKDKQIHKVNFMGENFYPEITVDKRPKFHKAQAPNIIHSIDALINREMVRRCYYDPKKINKIRQELMFPKHKTNLSLGTQGKKKSSYLLEIIRLYKETKFLSARILDYLDEDSIGCIYKLEPEVFKAIKALVQSLPKEPFEILVIHDNFKCLPSYGNDVRRTYNTILNEIHNSDILNHIIKSLGGKKLKIKREIKSEVILNANYTLT